MNMWSKLLTAVRGGMNDMGETIVDTQAIRILDQEIRDADEELKKSREALADILAQQKVAEEALKKYDTKIAEYDNYGIKALQVGNEKLALEVAEKIAQLEAERETEQQQVDQYAESVAKLRKAMAQAESNIKRLKQQVDIVKATESVQKAQVTVARRYGGSQAKLQTALDSMERIKKRQTMTAARLEANEQLETELADDQLTAKLKKAGIISGNTDAEAVLNRLRVQSQCGPEARSE